MSINNLNFIDTSWVRLLAIVTIVTLPHVRVIQGCTTPPKLESSVSSVVKYQTTDNSISEEVTTHYEVVCKAGYILSLSNHTRSNLVCKNNEWIMTKGNYLLNTENAECRPVCGAPCHNGGTCVAPNICSCPPSWEGRFCEILTCPDVLPSVDNGVITKGPTGPILTCSSGHKVTSVETAVALTCNSAKWAIGKAPSVPDSCNPIIAENNTVCGTTKDSFPTVKNAIVMLNNRGLVLLKCYSGFHLSGSDEVETALSCNSTNKKWKPCRQEFQTIGCTGFCSATCENNGKCVGNNVCECPEGFSGSRCEYKFCTELPVGPNTAVYIKYSTAYASCRKGFSFPDDSTSIEVKCEEGAWTYPKVFQYTQRIQCRPICSGKCQNGGWCCKPNKCICKFGFTGKFCEKKSSCLDFIPGVPFSRIVRVNSNKRHVATCQEGYTSESSTSVLFVECIRGRWLPINRLSTTSYLRCVPVCNLPCLNGGFCIGPNMCQCSGIYAGAQCQYIQTPGTCSLYPPFVPNSVLSYRTNNGTLKCEDQYSLPDNKKQLDMVCSLGRWIFGDYVKHPYSEFCLPICSIACRNGGTCIGPNKCSCLPKYTGTYCETLIKIECLVIPKPRPNAAISIRESRGMLDNEHYMVCALGYKFPNGRIREEILCDDQEWQNPFAINSRKSYTCQPICKKPCLHMGGCLAPDKCTCVSPFHGPTCETPSGHLCWDAPASIANARMFVSPEHVMVHCLYGYQLPNGNTQQNFTCFNGKWDSGMETLKCVPMCNPPCLNGGICIRPNMCDCKEGFVGLRCETYLGVGCKERPDAVVNGTIRLTAKKAILKCDVGYMLESNSNEKEFTCIHDNWIDQTDGKPFTRNVICLPICDHPCLKGGICIKPNVCQCTHDRIGRSCQYKKCVGKPPPLKNAVLTFSADHMHAAYRCIHLHRMQGGATGIKYSCINGGWILSRDSIDMNITPDIFCKPICDRPCLNGGHCVAPKICKCVQGFYGSQCQRRYETTINSEKCKFPFRFNGRFHYGCIDDNYHRPWCAITTNLHGLITSWDVCVADLDTSKVIITINNKVCEFPFTYNGKDRYHCIKDGKERPWCGVKYTGDNEDNWDYCDIDWGTNIAIITSTGRKCQNQFEFYGQMINGCVNDPARPWCSVHDPSNVNNDNVITDICLSDYGSYHTTITVTGEICRFPFKYRGRDQWACVSDRRGKSWCATKIDYSGVPIETRDCVPYGHIDQGTKRPELTILFPTLGLTNVNIKTVSGYTCAVPFTYKNNQIYGCTYIDSEEPWCAVEVDEFNNIINKDNCPPNWDIPDQPLIVETPCQGNGTCNREFTMSVFDTRVPSNVQLPGHTIKCDNGESCIFPFKYRGKVYNTCTFEDSILAWCPTFLDSHDAPIDWTYCPEGWNDKNSDKWHDVESNTNEILHSQNNNQLHDAE